MGELEHFEELMDDVTSLLEEIQWQPCVVCGETGDTTPCIQCDKLVCSVHSDGSMQCFSCDGLITKEM